MEQVVLQTRALTKVYPGSDRPAVECLDLTIRQGEILSILGRSGSGKSTLLSMLSTLIRPDSGHIFYHGEDIVAYSEEQRSHLRKTQFAVVFQQHHLMPYLTALENVLLPWMDTLSPVPRDRVEAARSMLVRVGLAGKESTPPGKLSGGEQQRVAIARAVLKGARILFADEPTGSLDSSTGSEIMELLQELNREGMTIVMVTHSPEYAKLAHRTITMADGRITTDFSN